MGRDRGRRKGPSPGWVDSRHWDGDPHAEEPGVWHTPGLALRRLGGPEPNEQGRGTRGEPRDGGGHQPCGAGGPDEEPGLHRGTRLRHQSALKGN